MTPMHRSLRPLLVAAVAFALAGAAGGCHWFKHKTDYAKSQEDRPLEVPPDLDVPDTSNATMPPANATALASATGRTAQPSTLTMSDVMVPDIAASALYPKLGAALESIEGVTINNRAEALLSYDVSYRGQNFLLRVQNNQGGSRLMAVSADGRMLNSGPGADLLKLVRAKL